MFLAEQLPETLFNSGLPGPVGQQNGLGSVSCHTHAGLIGKLPCSWGMSPETPHGPRPPATLEI